MIFPVETRGIGKPDYSKDVSAARERPGLALKYNQTLKGFGKSFSSINTGIHTAAPHETIMTDATAYFAVNALVLLTIINVTDGSSGIIIANTETTVTVLVLTGGISNQWDLGDAYYIPSPFPFVTTPLASGATTHIMDSETGLEMPFTVPVGYILTAISASFSYSQDMIAWLYTDGYLMANLGTAASGSFVYVAQIIGHSTKFIDPTGESSHTFDIQLTNEGGANMEGGGSIFCILEAVGTKPLPITKTVKCKFCGYEEVIPQETTKWICPKCKQLNIYYNLARFKGAP